jgi:hypothetical protein
LSNSTDHVELALPSPYDADILDIEYLDTWQPTADGGGRSLVLKSDATALSALDDGANWRASWASGGSPGRADLLFADQNGDGKVTIADLIQLRNKLGSANMTGDLTFDGAIDAKDIASLVSSFGIVAPPGSSPEASAAIVATRRTSTGATPATSAVAMARATALAVRLSATPSNDAASNTTASKLTARGSIARRPMTASAIDNALGSDDVLSATRTARVARTRSN